MDNNNSCMSSKESYLKIKSDYSFYLFVVQFGLFQIIYMNDDKFIQFRNIWAVDLVIVRES